ncbi:MAG TPA: lipoyl(octanoyl) transferase LipB [Candidatus Binatia bacterium]
MTLARPAETARPLCIERLGLRTYGETLALQTARRDAVLAGAPECLILVEHPPVITLGRGGDERHVLQRTAPVVRVNRGGDVTYHGPGQLVGYPILDLDRRGRDIHRYLRTLEAVLIDVAARFGIAAARCEGRTGVWVGNDKLAAIGIGVRRWVTMHGFALNVDDLRPAFRAIVPCGLADAGVTSLGEGAGRAVAMAEAEAAVSEAFCREFGYDQVVEMMA